MEMADERDYDAPERGYGAAEAVDEKSPLQVQQQPEHEQEVTDEEASEDSDPDEEGD
jgi:hypothetical protein